MALFGLGDITISKEKRKTSGPLKALEGTQYEFNTFRYPEDIGAFDKGHYIVIHINAQTRTQFASPEAKDEPTIIKNRRYLQSMRGGTNVGNFAKSTIDAATEYAQEIKNNLNSNPTTAELLKNVEETGYGIVKNVFGERGAQSISTLGSGAINQIKESAKSVSGENFLRTIKRTTDSIALYMPDTLQFDYRQNYDGISMSAGALGFAMAGQGMLEQYQQNGEMTGVGKNLASFLGLKGLQSTLGEQGNALFGALTGTFQNPALELIYRSPEFRSFQFDFKFYPRSESEALQVMKLIDRLRFHQAPEILGNTGGFFLVPPSEFDIEFYYNGKKNPNIHEISTCVLENIQVTFSPDGFSTYEVEGELQPQLGRTGTPVSIGMNLQFKETEILTKDSYTERNVGAE